MLQINVKEVVETKRDNKIQINDVIVKLSDEEAQAVLDLIESFDVQLKKVSQRQSGSFKRYEGQFDKDNSRCFYRAGNGVILKSYVDKGTFYGEKQSYALKMAVKTAGAKWDNETGLFMFDSEAKAKKFIRDQIASDKAYASKKK